MNEENNNSNKDSIDKIEERLDTIMSTENHKSKFENEDVLKYKAFATLSYIPFISILFILLNKYKLSEYLKFHINQGFILSILWIIIILMNRGFNDISILNFTSFLLLFICLILTVFGIVNTHNKESKELPIIGKLKLIKK